MFVGALFLLAKNLETTPNFSNNFSNQIVGGGGGVKIYF